VGVAVLLVLVMIGLLALSAYFSAMEAALFSLTRLQTHQLAERHDRASRRVLALLQKPERTLAALLVGNNLVNIALSSIATAAALFWIADRARAVELATLGVTVAVLLFGEVTPKALAVRFAPATARAVSGSFRGFALILGPLTTAFQRLAGLVLRALGAAREIPRQSALLTHAELRALLEETDDKGTAITPGEARLVQNILAFPQRTAGEIMTPRVDIVDLARDAAAEEIVRVMRATRHSRYPVFAQTPDDVVGFVQAKTFLLDPGAGLAERLRPVAFFPASARIDRIFHEFQRSRTGLVIVVNEYGEVVGLISREDVVEEILGDIYDEFDLEEPPIRKKGEGLYIVPGRIALPELEAMLSVTLLSDSAVTLNGFLCEVFGRIPRPGTVVEWEGLRFHVLEVVRHRVHRVLLELPARPGEERA
jgi:CBS domain containing-hemolysin-like protein